MEPSLKPKVLVTGASGFLAAHCIYYLLEKGYRVRGTVRSVKDPKKNQHLMEINPSKNQNLELVEADLLDPKSWPPAVKGCDYVLHTASPFPSLQPKHESELINPAIQGTRSVLLACIEHGIKKVVLTSSIASIGSGHKEKNDFNEEDWTIPELSLPYDKSKYFAEKEAWKIWKENPGKLNLTCINPGFIMGPTYTTSPFTSAEALTASFNDELMAVPKIYWSIVDVRDCAIAHVNAMEKLEETNGKRQITVGGGLWYMDMINLVAKEFEPQGYKFKKKEAGQCMLKFASWFDKRAETIVPLVGRKFQYDNTRSIKELGMQYRDLKSTVLDMAYSLIEKKFVKENKIKKK